MSFRLRKAPGSACRVRSAADTVELLRSIRHHFGITAFGVSASVPSRTISNRSRVMVPNAPYVFTRCSGSKLAFIDWRGDSMFTAGAMLRTATTAATTNVVNLSAGGASGSGRRTRSHVNQLSRSTGTHSTIVSQFNQERLPDTISADWNRIVTSAAIEAIGCGSSSPTGTISSTT